MTEIDVELTEGEVAVVGALHLGCGNVWEREFVDADGRQRSGLTAIISPVEPESDSIVVGVASRFTVGEWTFRVTDIVDDARAVVRLHATGPDPATARAADAEPNPGLEPHGVGPGAVRVRGVDWAPGRIASVVDDVMQDRMVLSGPRDVTHAVDGLILAYRDLAGHPEIREEIGRCVAGHLERSAGAAEMFFDHYPTAAGGERFAELAVGRPATARTAELIFRAFWRQPRDEPPAPELLEQARECILAGHGRRLLFTVAQHDPQWCARHRERLLGVAEQYVGAFWDLDVADGVDPVQAMRALLPVAGETGRKDLTLTLRFSTVDDATKARCTALLAEA